MILNNKDRYLQIAFNYDTDLVYSVLESIPYNDHIFIEAGTPYIKNNGMSGVSLIRAFWSGIVVADLKTTDGAFDEVNMACLAGANAATVNGNAPQETLNLFIKTCKELKMISMIDMIGVSDPLKVLRGLKLIPDVVILHLGRDEESTKGKMIEYRHVNRIKSKFDVLIAAAGGVDLKEARSAVFNGANIIIVNLVKPKDPWRGIYTTDDVGMLAQKFLETIK